MPHHDDLQEQKVEYITPDQPGGICGWREGIPVIRIFTCGLLSIQMLQEVPGGDPKNARYEALPAESLRGQGPAPACKLVKLLSSQKERYASKDWLLTHLREGEELSITPRRLENIVSSLRKLLRLKSGKRLQDLLTYERATHESGDGYRLAGYPLVWLDVDALAWNVRQACLKERFNDDPFPYWQRAYDLASRGPFLLDEPNSEWALARREEVQDHLRQSVRALARLWLTRFGQRAEEDVLRMLRAYRREHPGDEDLLRPLLELLTKRGDYSEVLDYYDQLKEALEAQGLTRDGNVRIPYRLTEEIVDYARLKLREGTATRSSEEISLAHYPVSPSAPVHQDVTSLPFSLSLPQQIQGVAHGLILQEEFDTTPAQTQRQAIHPVFSPPEQDIMSEGDSKRRKGHDMDRLRRHLLQLGAGASGMLLSSASQSIIHSDLEIVERLVRVLEKPAETSALFLTHLEATTRNNRKRFVLAKNSVQDIHSLYQDVSAHLFTITQLLEHSLPTQLSCQLCTLAGETAQLLGDICFHEGNTERATTYYDTAMKAASEGQNEVLQAVILGRKSFLPLYCGNAKDALPLLRQAHLLASRNATDIIRAWLMVVEAEVQATVGDAEACERALHQSEDLLHRSQPGFATCSFSLEAAYAPLNESRLLGYQGACYLRLHQPQKAQPVLHTYLASRSHASLHKRSITLVDLAKAYALQGEMEEMYYYADQALHLLEQTRSTHAIQRVLNLRRDLHHWQDAAPIKQLDQRLAAITSSSTP